MRVFPINLFWIVSRRQLVALLLVLNYPDVRNSREKVLVLGHTSKQSPSWWTVRAAGAQSVCSHVMSMSGKGNNEHICTCAQLTTPFLYSPGSLPRKWCHPQCGHVLPHLPVQSRQPLTEVLRDTSPGSVPILSI